MNRIFNISLSKIEETTPVRSAGWVNYDVDNLYPNRLIDLYLSSPTNKAILDYKSQLTMGEGFKAIEGVLPQGVNWDKLLTKVSKDINIFNGFALLIGWSRDKTTIAQVKHLDYSMVRAGRKDNLGKVNSYFITDWNEFKKSKVLELPVYDPNNIPDYNVSEYQVYVYQNYTPGMSYYTQPDYAAGYKAIECEKRLMNFYERKLKDGFSVNTIISIPSNNLSQEEMIQMEEDLKWAYSSEGGEQMMVIFGENGIKPEITTTQGINAEVLKDLNEIIVQKIITSHRLSSPTLASLPGAGSLGGNGSEIAVATDYFYSQTIRSKQIEIEIVFNELFAYMNNCKVEIENLLIFNNTNGTVEEQQ